MHCGVFLKSAFYGLMRHFCYAFLHSIFSDSIESVSTNLQEFYKNYPINQTLFFCHDKKSKLNLRFIMLTYYDKNYCHFFLEKLRGVPRFSEIKCNYRKLVF